MRARSTLFCILASALVLGRPGPLHPQALSDAVVRSTVPARFQAGDTLRVSFRFDVPDSVGTAALRVLLLDGGDVVGALRRVRPGNARGSGVGEALEVFTEPVVADGIRIMVRGRNGFLDTSDLPLRVGAEPTAGGLERPGWIDPGRPGGPGTDDTPLGPGSADEGRLVALAVEPRAPLAVLLRAPRDTLTAQEAIRFSPAAVRRLAQGLIRPPPVQPSSVELLRRRQSEALVEVLRGARVVEPAAPVPAPPVAVPFPPVPAGPPTDTLDTPGPWTIEPDGSMRRTHPDGTVEVIDPAGNRMTCSPDPESGELRCLMPLFAQIPRVIPSSEIATVDVAWLESMDAWLEQLAADALAEMRTLVDDDASIEAYLGLEEGQNLYQRLDLRLEFLSRLIN